MGTNVKPLDKDGRRGMEGGGGFPCEICANIPSMQGKLTLKKKRSAKLTTTTK